MMEPEKLFHYDYPIGTRIRDAEGRVYTTIARPHMAADGKVYIHVQGGNPLRPLRLEGVSRVKSPRPLKTKALRGKSLL